MFEEYEAAVLQDYADKKENGKLLRNLAHPTPGSLKKECLNVFDKRYGKKDEVTLKSFFELKGEPEDYRAAMRKWDIGKFKALRLFLDGETNRTGEQNIELLAWLTDFQPRPYAMWLRDHRDPIAISVSPPEEEPEPKEPEYKEEANEQEGQPPEKYDKPGKATTYKQLLPYAALLIVVLIAGYFILTRQRSDQGNCMYWTGDHYQRIACNERPDDTTVTVIGLDSNKMVHFKRITRADTLTGASIGKVWYIKLNSGVEYYTAPGEHPLYPERRLLPLTAYILNKYPRKSG